MISLEFDDQHARARLERIEGNLLLGLGPAATAVFAALERHETDIFAALHGRYVNTGRTRLSLTADVFQDAGDAIRQAHARELVFGSSVGYAVYLKRPPILTVESVMGSDTAKEIAAAILEHIIS